MTEIDPAQLLEDATSPDADLDALSASIDEALADNDNEVQAAKDDLTVMPTDPTQRLLAETTFGRVWPKVQTQLQSAHDGNVVQAARDALGGVDPVARSLMAQEIIDYLSSRGLNDDSITRHVLVPASSRLSDALDTQARNRRNAVIARHNIAQVRQGTTRYVMETAR